MSSTLMSNYRWYQGHRRSIVARYRGRFVVVAGRSVVADYATEEEAMRFAFSNLTPGTFLVRKCVPLAEERHVVCHSRAAFT